jgi:hypothetical protein
MHPASKLTSVCRRCDFDDDIGRESCRESAPADVLYGSITEVETSPSLHSDHDPHDPQCVLDETAAYPEMVSAVPVPESL